jgi:hypothetical protein
MGDRQDNRALFMCLRESVNQCGIQTVLDQYEAVLCSLEEMSGSSKTDTATKAAGLLVRFQQGSTVCGLQMASQLFGLLEQLNRSLQSTSITMSGMIMAAETVNVQLQMQRTDEAFNQLLRKVREMVVEHNLEPLSLPRQRRPPRRLTGAADAYFADTVEVFYRTVFFEFVDTAVNQLGIRFDRSQPGLSRYMSLEQVLLSGTVDTDLCQPYPELDGMILAIQLQMFRSSYPSYTSLSDAQQILQNMVPEVRLLFTQVEQLVRLLLVCPVSSCAAERSFSALRRLKNWLRSTMSQIRLNSVAVCHVNQPILDLLDLRHLAAEFWRTLRHSTWNFREWTILIHHHHNHHHRHQSFYYITNVNVYGQVQFENATSERNSIRLLHFLI